jgi:hypothetical protein
MFVSCGRMLLCLRVLANGVMVLSLMVVMSPPRARRRPRAPDHARRVQLDRPISQLSAVDILVESDNDLPTSNA